MALFRSYISILYIYIYIYIYIAHSLSSKGNVRLSFFVESSKKRKVVKISRYLNVKIALIVLICLRLLIQAIISGMQLKGVDIETNPDPTYNLDVRHAFS